MITVIIVSDDIIGIWAMMSPKTMNSDAIFRIASLPFFFQHDDDDDDDFNQP